MKTARPTRRPLPVVASVLVACALALSLVGASAADARPPEHAKNKHRGTVATTTTTTTSAPAPKPDPSPDSDECGAVRYKADGTAWECTFEDDFDGTELDRTKWAVERTDDHWYHSGPECFLDHPDNVSVSGGTLDLTVREVDDPVTCHDKHGPYTTAYTSGMVTTNGTFDQAYGRFEIRAKMATTPIPGLHTAFWLWPEDAARYGGWPWSGEIDIAEIYSLYSDRAIPFIHYATATFDPTVTNNYCLIDDVSAFHTYAVEWTAETMTIIFDGEVCLTHRLDPMAPLTGSQPFDQPFFIALTQALGIGTNAFEPGRTPLPATTAVDWVRVWK